MTTPPSATAPASTASSRGFADARNRREHERQDLNKPVRIHEIGDFDRVDAGSDGRAVDVSRSGVGISTRKMLHIGRRVIVLLPGANGAQRALFGEVCFAAYKEGGTYHIGVRLCPKPESSAITQWLRVQRAV